MRTRFAIAGTMDRRRFVGNASLSLLVATTSAGAIALPLSRELDDYYFFDERFPRAERLAVSARGERIVPVRSDVTEIWNSGLRAAALAAPLVIGGVTTESFLFCLSVLIREHAALDARAERLDRDLQLWTLRSTP
jgi:hypothetical protein